MAKIHFEDGCVRLSGKAIDILTGFSCLFDALLEITPNKMRGEMVRALHLCVNMASEAYEGETDDEEETEEHESLARRMLGETYFEGGGDSCQN